MAPIPGSPHDLQSIGLWVMLIVALCVFYVRLAVRIAIIAVIGLSIYGAILFVEGLQHMVR